MNEQRLNQLKKEEAYRRAGHRMERAQAGHFATTLAQAYYYADSNNARKIENSFSELFQRFMTPTELELFADQSKEQTQ